MLSDTAKKELQRIVKTSTIEEIAEYLYKNVALNDALHLLATLLKDSRERPKRIRISKDEFIEHFTIIQEKQGKKSLEQMEAYTEKVIKDSPIE